MKKKFLIHFQVEGNRFRVKNQSERLEAHYIMVAMMPDGVPIYAATIDSEISNRFRENRAKEILSISLIKDKDKCKKYIQIEFADNSTVSLENEDYFLLFHVPQRDNHSEDFILVYNKPNMLGDDAHYHVFESDAVSQNASALFWLLKEYIPVKNEEE